MLSTHSHVALLLLTGITEAMFASVAYVLESLMVLCDHKPADTETVRDVGLCAHIVFLRVKAPDKKQAVNALKKKKFFLKKTRQLPHAVANFVNCTQ